MPKDEQPPVPGHDVDVPPLGNPELTADEVSLVEHQEGDVDPSTGMSIAAQLADEQPAEESPYAAPETLELDADDL